MSYRVLALAFFLVACGSSDDDGKSANGNGGSGNASSGGSSSGGSSSGGSGGSGGSTSGGSGGSSGSSTGGSGGGTIACSKVRPGPDTTGVPAGTTLTPSGSITVEENGAIIEGLDIQGEIHVLADNVTIRKVRITSGDYYPIRYFDNDNVGLVVEDTEIIGTNGDVTSGISFANYTARRVNIHGGADGMKADSNVLIEDSWIHDLSNGDGEHNDCVQSTGGKSVTIRGSFLEGASNAAVQTGDENAATEDLTIECSWLYGGGYTLNIRGVGATAPKNTVIKDNRFGRDSGYGPWTIDDPNPTVTGNVYDDDDEPIPYP